MLLGAIENNLLDITKSYSIFLNGGYIVEPNIIKKIVSDKGQLISEESLIKAQEEFGEDAFTAGIGAEAVLEMLSKEIKTVENIPSFLESVQKKEALLMGFGHRVSKSYDPRAKYLKIAADKVFEITGTNPLLDIALKLESIALSEDYFKARNLYPNVDFYSGLIYESMGIPTPMFTVLFAVGRTPGWLAQWKEFLNDKDQKIARPRQVYIGYDSRDYLPLESR
mgnify:CR=1 FL=1